MDEKAWMWRSCCLTPSIGKAIFTEHPEPGHFSAPVSQLFWFREPASLTSTLAGYVKTMVGTGQHTMQIELMWRVLFREGKAAVEGKRESREREHRVASWEEKGVERKRERFTEAES